MILAWLLLLTGLTLSAVAIYYSVVGLAAIFSAAVIPIYIMGSSLEVAKLVKFGTEPLKKIANQYQLKIKTLGNIRYGQTWKHLQNV